MSLPIHAESLLRNLRLLSLFSPTPLSVVFAEQPHHVGEGYGFISHTVWERSTLCLESCRGGCCTNWKRPGIGPLWHPSELFPPNLDEHVAHVNGVEFRYRSQKNLDNQFTCGFWDPATGRCQIYSTGKPVHCDIDPQMGVFPCKKGKLGLFRRLPPRNWRFPKCPVDMSETRPSDASRAEMDRVLAVYQATADTLQMVTVVTTIQAVRMRLLQLESLPNESFISIERIVAGEHPIESAAD